MTKNQKILAAVAVAGIAIYIWKKRQSKDTETPIITTRPAMLEETSNAIGGHACTCPSTRGGITRYYTSFVCPCPPDRGAKTR